MKTYAIRLKPGEDLKMGLDELAGKLVGGLHPHRGGQFDYGFNSATPIAMSWMN